MAGMALSTVRVAAPLAAPRGAHAPARIVLLRAEGDRQRLQAQVQQTNEVLRKVADELALQQAQQLADRASSVSAAEDAVRTREAAIWEREYQRWEAERQQWAAREARMLDHIARLHDTLLHLSTAAPQQQQQQQASPPPLAAPAASEQASGEQSPASSQQAQGSPVGASRNGDAPQRAASSPAESSASSPATLTDAELHATTTSRVQDSLLTAFSAVDDTDILTADFDALLAQPSQAAARRAPQQPLPAQPGTPPLLSLGADDIFWMSQLHERLTQASLFPSEEDLEDWVYGESTQSAVLTYQAFVGLPETGTVDDATWRALLGADYGRIAPPPEPEGTLSAADASLTGAAAAAPANGATPLQQPVSPEQLAIRELRASSELENRKRTAYAERQASGADVGELIKWPVLREGDGGRSVHRLQVALERQGFIPDEEEQRWWMFGSSTHDCLVTFQACASLGESGVADERTWQALLGAGAQPADLAALTNEHEDDMSDTGDAVWLLGEQRWERRRRA